MFRQSNCHFLDLTEYSQNLLANKRYLGELIDFQLFYPTSFLSFQFLSINVLHQKHSIFRLVENVKFQLGSGYSNIFELFFSSNFKLFFIR